MARIVAHLIVGAKPEPFLPAMLASIAGPIEHVFINENSGLGNEAPNLPAIESCALAQHGRLTLARTAFAGFAAARNVCFQLDRDADERTWVVFMDADEVHGGGFERIAQKLGRLPASIGFVDGFTWHFFKSFDWYRSIERRMMFHRWTPQAKWAGEVHEQLAGVPGGRVALPYVYAHYGWLAPFSEDARKGAQYSALGAQGTPLGADDARAADFQGDYRAVDGFFADWWRRLMRFTGSHPPAAIPIIDRERQHRAHHYSEIERIIRKHQPPLQRASNALMKLNYEQRWRMRALDAARYGML